jgi:hypothetical protein
MAGNVAGRCPEAGGLARLLLRIPCFLVGANFYLSHFFVRFVKNRLPPGVLAAKSVPLILCQGLVFEGNNGLWTVVFHKKG